MEIIKLIRNTEDGVLFFINSNYGELLFDTGAATSQLNQHEINLSQSGVYTKQSHGVKGSIEQQMISIDSLVIGSLEQPLPEVSLSERHGILGMDFLKHYCLCFDLGNDQIEVLHSLTEGNSLRLGPKWHSFIPCEISGKTVWGLFDTGASITIVDSAFASMHPEAFTYLGQEIGTDSTGTKIESDSIQIRSMKIKNYEFAPHLGATADLSFISKASGFDVALIIGTSTIMQKVWEFDYQNKLWRFRPSRNDVNSSATNNGSSQ